MFYSLFIFYSHLFNNIYILIGFMALLISLVLFMLLLKRKVIIPERIEENQFYNSRTTEADNYELNQNNRLLIKTVDVDKLLEEFKETVIYTRTISYLVNPQEENEPNMNELNRILYGHFLQFRLYLHSVSPKMIDTDIDYCILTLAGFRQKDMFKIMNNITPSGVRNIKPRLKDRLPDSLYSSFFLNDYTVY